MERSSKMLLEPKWRQPWRNHGSWHHYARVEEERRLWEAIPRVPDFQCAWLIFWQGVNPRSNHTFRTVPPTLATEHSHIHDEGICTTVQSLLGEIPGSEAEMNDAKQVATLSMRMLELGLRSAVRCADAACWASWANAMHMISERNPAVADRRDEEPDESCLVDPRSATNKFDRDGFWWRLSWANLHGGHRKPDIDKGEPGEWRDRWQYWSSPFLTRTTGS